MLLLMERRSKRNLEYFQWNFFADFRIDKERLVEKGEEVRRESDCVYSKHFVNLQWI